VVTRADQRAAAAGAARDEPGKEIACSSGAHGPHERSDRRSAGTRTEAKTEDRGHCGPARDGKNAVRRGRYRALGSITSDPRAAKS